MKDTFFTPQAPVGLKAMGLQSNYLDKVYKNNFSVTRFYNEIMSPVKDPFLLSDFN